MNEEKAKNRVIELDRLISIAKQGSDFVRAGRLNAERRGIIAKHPEANSIFELPGMDALKDIFK